MIIFPSIASVLLGTAASMVIGMMWYGPLRSKVGISDIKKDRKSLAKLSKEQKVVSELTTSFSGNLLMAFSLGAIALTLGITAIHFLALFILFMWLGFVLASNKSWFDAFHMLAVLIAQGLILFAIDIV